MKSLRKKIMLTPPDEVHLRLRTQIKTYEQLQKYLWKKFHIDIDTDPKSDYYEDLFYNEDLRSLMGFIHYQDKNGFIIILWARYYIGETPHNIWSKEWRQLIRESDILDDNFNTIEEGIK